MGSTRYRLTLEEDILNAPDHGPHSFSYEEQLQLKGGPEEIIGACRAIIRQMEEVKESNAPVRATTGTDLDPAIASGRKLADAVSSLIAVRTAFIERLVENGNLTEFQANLLRAGALR